MTTQRKKYLEAIYRPKLDQGQKEILDRFIRNFLPSTGEKRRYPSNSLHSVHNTLDRIFINHLGFGISERDVLDAFLRMNYGFRTHLQIWSDLKIKSTIGFFEHVYDEIELVRKKYSRAFPEHEINISVSGNDVNNLYYSQNRIPIENGNVEKTIIPRIQLKDEIKIFFNLPTDFIIEDYVPKKYLKEIGKKPKQS
jgi:hypothetical protein